MTRRPPLTIPSWVTDDADVERVARAIYYGSSSGKKPWDYRSDDYQEKFREQAWRALYEIAHPF